jgi:hypothetical protein
MADKEEEIFELVDDTDSVIGTDRRGTVHRLGLLHRAVYCWVFNSQGEVLIQQRSALKKIGPNQWDLSVAEHLQPGESYVKVSGAGRVSTSWDAVCGTTLRCYSRTPRCTPSAAHLDDNFFSLSEGVLHVWAGR